MSKNVLFSSDKKNWETPQKFFDALNEEFHFTLDAAASHENHKCENYYTEEQDGLAQDWGGKQYGVIRRMGGYKQEHGQKNATKSPENRILRLSC